MVTRALVEHEIDAGRRLLEELDQQGTEVIAAFWLYNAEQDYWRLNLAMPVCDQMGPDVAYSRIQAALKKIPEENQLSLLDITAANTKEVIVQALCRLVKTGRGIARFRVSRSAANGVYIDDALIYRTT